MKRLTLLAATASLLLASCSDEIRTEVANPGQEVQVSFSASLPEQMLSRATNVSDGTTANRLNYTVFKDSKAITSGDVSDAFQDKKTKSQTVSLPLITGETYSIVFWADNSSSPYSYSDGVVTVDYAKAYANDENADAFFGQELNYTVTGSASKTVTLTRPFAQINFGTTKADYEAAVLSGLDASESAVAIKTQTDKTFNLIDESVADAVDEVTYLNLTTPTDEDDPFSLNPDQRAALTVDGTDYVYVGYAYVLTQPENKAENITTVTLTPVSAGETVRTYTNVPVKRNYRTNIIGNLFTSSVDYTVLIDQNYVDDINVEVWDGSIEQPTISGTTVHIANAAELAWLADYVNNATEKVSRAEEIPFDFSGYTVELTEDIYLNDEPWTPIGLNADNVQRKFKGTFDGKGYTIYNLHVEQEAAYRAAGLFGALNGTAKDFTIDGAYVNSLSSGSATDNGIAVVAGSIYDGGTIDGVTVKNAEVYGNRYCGGVAGYTYGNVTNCAVDGITIVCTPDNLTGSYDNGDKVGGLVGYFVDKSTYVVDNCTVNNAKVTGYRDLGGLIGCANKATSVNNCTVSNTKIIPSSTNAYSGHSAGENTDLIVGRQISGPLPASNTAVNTTINVTTFNGATYAYDDTPWDGESTQEPTIDSDGNVIVASAAQLAGLAAMVNAGEELYQKDVYLLCDVDLAGHNWTSIGCEANKFGGNFDGQGHTISNLYIKDSIEPGVYEQSQNCGLFGWVRRERRY